MAIPSTVLGQVESLYVGYFGRAGDPSGVNSWVSSINAGKATFASIASLFGGSQEAINKYPYLATPSISSPTTFVTQIYNNLFNRAPDAAGLTFWTNYLNANNGNATAVGTFISTIIQTAASGGTDDATIQNKTSFAGDFTTQVNNNNITFNGATAVQSSNQLALVTSDATTVTTQTAATTAYIATAPGPVTTLTPSVETVSSTATNANFNAPLFFNSGSGTTVETLNTGDVIIGNGSSGTSLTASLNTAGAHLIQMSGVLNETVTTTAAVSVQGQGATGVTGVTTLTDLNSSGTLQIGAAGNGNKTALTTVNMTNSTANLNVFVAAAALSGSADAVTVNVTGATGTNAAPIQLVLGSDGAVGTATTAQNAYETETINNGSASFLQLSSAATGVLSTSALTLKGAGALQLSAAAAGDFANLKTIDATAETGGVVIEGTAAVNASNTALGAGVGLLNGNTGLTSFKGGSGADFIDLSSMTAAQLGAITSGNLDGGAGTDILLASTAAAHGTSVINQTNFETLGIASDAGGTVNASNFGSSITTFQLFGAANAGADTFTNVASGTTLALAGLGGGQAYTVTMSGSGTSDILNITANNTTGTGTLGATTFTGAETINMTFSGSTNAETFGALAATPTAGGVVTLNMVDNLANAIALSSTSTVNVGTGSLVLTGTNTNTFTLGGTLTASRFDASGYSGNVTMGAFGAAAAITENGSGGADTLNGSTGADTISGGAGNDVLATMISGAGGVAAGDSLTGGSGNDQFILRGSAVSGTIQSSFYSANAAVTDMTVGSSTSSTDFVSISATGANYNTLTNALAAAIATTAQGSVVVQNVAQNAAAAAAVTGFQVIKLTTAVSPTNGTTTLQAAFNSAIGTATVTGLTATKSYIALMYDATNSKMDILAVDDNAGTNTVIETGDAVQMIGSVNMSASDYANIGANHFSIIAA